MRLRRTLVLLQIAMVAAGLLIFGVTSYRLYGQREEQRIHSQLVNNDLPQLEMALCQQDEGSGCAGDFRGARNPSTSAALSASTSGTTCPASSGGFLFPNLTPGSFAEFLSASGKVLGQLYVVPFQAAEDATKTCPDPDLPASIPPGAFKVRARSGPGPFLVESQPVSTSRPTTTQRDFDATSPVATSPVATGPVAISAAPARIVAGVPLNQLGDSLHHLLVVDLIVGVILLLALGAGSLVLIRRSLRPLERMAATSRAISAGDLSRRVTAIDERSEVGQLGLALNGMLTRIEGAFAARDATEQRLRQFLADASHELRTPLTSIRGYAELWRLNSQAGRAGPTPGSELDADTAMARIEEHARRMGEMIEELLLLARLDEFRPTQPVPVDLAVLAAEECGEAAALDPGRPISLHADEDVIVTGELSHLRRAVANLLTNAVRHTPPGTRVEVHVDKGDGVARLIVRDHGPGMPEAGLAHAFDRFWQADASRGSGGSGLGLAIVAGVASEHGGLATVANAPDGGAVLTLRLPLPLPRTEGHDIAAPFPS